MKVPEGYRIVSGPESEGFARPGDMDWVAEALRMDGTLRGWASGRASAESLQGRGPVYAFDAPDQSVQYVVRPYRRGGAIAPVLGDRFLSVGTPRPLTELRASVEARARGIRTPPVVAGAVYRRPGFYRADIVTERAPGRNLADVLWDADVDRRHVARAVGRFVAEVAEAGLRHTDLNVTNMLVGPDPAHSILVLDLDRARVGTPVSGRRMRARLARSLRKLERERGELPADVWSALDDGFGEDGT